MWEARLSEIRGEEEKEIYYSITAEIRGDAEELQVLMQAQGKDSDLAEAS